MAIGKRNSGKVKQDAVVAQFAKDARLPVSKESAVAIAMLGKDEREAYAAAQALKLAAKPRISFYVPK
jgi:hydrogenase maturation factor